MEAISQMRKIAFIGAGSFDLPDGSLGISCHSPAKITATLDRADALKSADGVVVTILAGGVQVWRHDIEIPKR